MKKIESTILAGLLGLAAFTPVSTLAADNLELKLKLYLDDKVITNVPMELYFVAAGDQEEYRITDDFLAFKGDLDDLDLSKASSIQEAAEELSEYIEEFSVEPLEIRTTNENGEAVFENLTSGLYFIPESVFTLSDELITTESVVLWLDEDTTAYPKGHPASGDTPNDPDNPGSGSDIPNEGDDPSTSIPQRPGGGSNNSSGSGNNNSSGSGFDIGNSATDPTYSAPVNTAAESNLPLYGMLFMTSAAILGSLMIFKRKNHKA